MLPIIALLLSFTLSANLMASKISEKPKDFICNEIQAKSRILKQFNRLTITPEINNVIENAYNNILSSKKNYEMAYNNFKKTETKFYSMSLVEQRAVAFIINYIMGNVHTYIKNMIPNNDELGKVVETNIYQQLLQDNDNHKNLDHFLGSKNIAPRIHQTIHGLTTKICIFYEENKEISQGPFSQPVILPCGHMIEVKHGAYYAGRGTCSTCGKPISMQTLLKNIRVE
jgi:hypothetical protein